jgi:ADP-ribose pyrophosphatase YjhB (NUDIX family)
MKYPRIRVSVIVIEEGTILLVRHEKGGKTYWVLPGGGVDFGETLQQAAVRELKEETNLDIEVDKLVFVDDFIPEDRHRHVLDVYFTATVVGGELKLGSDSIMREVRYFPIEELAHLTFYPEIADRIVEGYREGFPRSPSYLGNVSDSGK